MKFLRFALFSVLCLLPLWLPAVVSSPVRKGAVKASLVTPEQGIQAGKSFWVALKLEHDEHWHSYWINPGTGYPTSIKWTLPAGFTAGPIVWPTPHVVKDTRGNVTGHGYEGTVFLFTEITAPANLPAGTPVTLNAKADWLMCSEVCMPGDAKLELTLPVTAGQPEPDMTIARLFNNNFADLPKPLDGWTVAASRTADTFTVRVTPATAGTTLPPEVHLYDNAGLIDYSAPQELSTDQGALVLKLKAASDGPADATRLAGILVAAHGWGGLVLSHGATFDVPIGTSSQQLASPKPGEGGSVLRPPSSVSAPPAAGLAGTLLLALLGGLILNLMPCVFPVLGIKVLGFVNQSGSDRGKVVKHGLIFTLGVLLSFWALAGLLLALRAGGSQLGWGFQLQSPAFVFGMTAFLLVFALNLSGLFEVGLSATGVGGKLQMQDGYGGSFFTGVLATLVATPCSAPFLAPALGAALALSAGESFLVFTAIALGLSAPYLLLSIFPSAVKILPRPGAWMETFKQLMAFPLYATVGALLWVLAGQTKDNDYALLFIVFGLVLVAMAAWVYGRFGRGAGRLVAVVLVAGGVWLGWPKEAAAAPVTASGYSLKWEHWSPEAVTAARAAGRTIYVDFTARWCATCQTNKAAVFSSNDVLAALEKKNVLLLKADWTSRDPAITEELAKWNRSAVPFNLIYAPNLAEPIVLPELLTPGTVLDELAKTAAK